MLTFRYTVTATSTCIWSATYPQPGLDVSSLPGSYAALVDPAVTRNLLDNLY